MITLRSSLRRLWCWWFLWHLCSSLSTACCLDHAPLALIDFGPEEGVFRMLLRWTEASNIVLWHKMGDSCLFGSNLRIFPILIKIKWFTYSVRCMLGCLRMLGVSAMMWMNQHVRIVWCLYLKLVVGTGVWLARVRYHPLTRATSSGSDVSRVLIASAFSMDSSMRGSGTFGKVEILSTITRWRRLEEEVILQLLALGCGGLVAVTVSWCSISSVRIGSSGRSVVDGGICVALDSVKFVLVIVVHFLFVITVLVAEEIREASLARCLVSGWIMGTNHVNTTGLLVLMVLILLILLNSHRNVLDGARPLAQVLTVQSHHIRMASTAQGNRRSCMIRHWNSTLGSWSLLI